MSASSSAYTTSQASVPAAEASGSFGSVADSLAEFGAMAALEWLATTFWVSFPAHRCKCQLFPGAEVQIGWDALISGAANGQKQTLTHSRARIVLMLIAYVDSCHDHLALLDRCT